MTSEKEDSPDTVMKKVFYMILASTVLYCAAVILFVL